MPVTPTVIKATPNSVLYQLADDGSAEPLSSPTRVYTPDVDADSAEWVEDWGLWVVGGAFAAGSNRILTSPDGLNWTARGPAVGFWRDSAYSPQLGRMVLVSQGGSGEVVYSDDGITWTLASATAANQWQSVAWSPTLGLFAACAVSGTNQVMTSPDGINWTPRGAGDGVAALGWNGIVWADSLNLFVAMAQTGPNHGITSPDGVTWTPRATQLGTWTSLAWSPELGLLASVGLSGAIQTSDDGINWDAQVTPEVNNWDEITWARFTPTSGYFVATALSGTNRILYSADGVTWGAFNGAVTFACVGYSPDLNQFLFGGGDGIYAANAQGADIPRDLLGDLAAQAALPGGSSLYDILNPEGGHADQTAARAAFLAACDVYVHTRTAGATAGPGVTVDQDVRASETDGNFRLVLNTAKADPTDVATVLVRVARRHTATR